MTPPVYWPIARLRLIGGGIWLAAAALAIAGTFLPLLEQGRGRNRPAELYTAWGTSSGDSDYPLMGIPIVVASVLLVIAAGLGLMSARLHPASGPVLAARMLGASATGLVGGAIWMLFVVTRVFDSGDDSPTRSRPSDYDSAIGFGTWLLLGAAVLAVAGAVLMLIPKVSSRKEPETPAMGIPIVRVLEPEYDPVPESESPVEPLVESVAEPEPEPAADPKG